MAGTISYAGAGSSECTWEKPGDLCGKCYAAGKASTRPMRREGIRQMLRRVKALGACSSTRYAFTECDVAYWLGVARRESN